MSQNKIKFNKLLKFKNNKNKSKFKRFNKQDKTIYLINNS
jgi:hypothetical protein